MAKTKAPKMIPVPPAARQQISAFNNFMAGVRTGLDVPVTWVMNPTGTAFVPPKENA